MHGLLTVNINGIDKPVRLNNHFLFELGQSIKCDPIEAGQKIAEIAAKNPILGYTHILYAGLIGAQYEMGNLSHGIELHEVAKFASTANDDQIAPIWAVFKEAMQIPDATPEQIEAYRESLATEEKKS